MPRGDHEAAQRALLDKAHGALRDESPAVRAEAVRLLGERERKDFLALTADMAADPSPEVRKALLACLVDFMDEPEAVRRVADAVTDTDAGVRAEALSSLETSTAMPSVQVLTDLLHRVHGQEGVRVIALLRQQEDAGLPALLEPGFAGRSAPEQEAVLSALAGHADEATLRIVRLGLGAPEPLIQRLALLRLLQFPARTAGPILDASRAALAPALARLAQDVHVELSERLILPFLVRHTGPMALADEQPFPSQQGTLPLVSPDGQWVAYQDRGGSRPGGSSWLGRTSLVSLVHVVRVDGTGDRIVSDMFLRGWLQDSVHVASARDGFAAITDLEGHAVMEFGAPYRSSTQPRPGEPADWRQREMRLQGGTGRMPHRQALPTTGLAEDEKGEDAAFSPDGKWFGPLRTQLGGVYLATGGSRLPMLAGEGPTNGPIAWAPDAHRAVFVNDEGHLILFSFDDLSMHDLGAAQPPPRDRWVGDPVWRPWDRSGRRVAFVRDGEVWVRTIVDGSGRQLTFDGTPKRQPVFSPDGSRIAYVASPPIRRRYVEAPADVWVVDVRTTLAARVTGPDGCGTAGLDWFDRERLVFDRLGGRTNPLSTSSLRLADLVRPAGE